MSMNTLFSGAEDFIPGLPAYRVPKTMGAYAIIKGKKNSFELTEVVVPKIGHDEALICVRASALNYNTIWTIDSNPVSSFDFLRRIKQFQTQQKTIIGHFIFLEVMLQVL